LILKIKVRADFKSYCLITLYILLFLVSILYLCSGINQTANWFVSSSKSVTLNVVDSDDYAVILWICNNLPENATILVHPEGAGQLIPVIADRRIIYPKGVNQLSKTYRYIIDQLIKEPNDPKLYELLKQLRVSHIYCDTDLWKGAKPFDVQKMLSSNKYTLIFRFGNTYLFKIN